MLIKGHNSKKVTQPAAIAKILQAILKAEHIVDQDKEHFWTIGLTANMRIKYIELVSLGSLTASVCNPREVFRFAIIQGVNSILIAHNHPGGEMRASIDDIKITERLVKSGEILAIQVNDHIIISKDDFYSFKEHGII